MTASGHPIRNFVVVALATGHAIKLLAGMFPEARRPDLLPRAFAGAYETLTASRQQWDVFRTIPLHHAYRARIVITDSHGGERVLGPLLPGFQDYPVPENARIYNLFTLMLSGAKGTGWRDAWLLKTGQALRQSQAIGEGESWCLEVDADFTRHLVHVRRDGRLFQRMTKRFTVDAPEGAPVEDR